MGKIPVCLSIGGSDSSAGAGVQADLRVFEALGIRGCCAITALTAQNPHEILRITPSPPEQLQAEIEAVFSYYDVRAVKTGMLVDATRIGMVARALAARRAGNLVVDPVMQSTSGHRLLACEAIAAMREKLIPQALLLTPNLDEGAALLGRPIDDVEAAACELAHALGCNVLLKGGHGKEEELCDVLAQPEGRVECWRHPRLDWDIDAAHGGGCRLAAAIAAFLALGRPLVEAVGEAIAWNTAAA